VKARLYNLREGVIYFGNYAPWHSDKTAKTGLVGFGIINLGVIRNFCIGVDKRRLESGRGVAPVGWYGRNLINTAESLLFSIAAVGAILK